MKHFKQLDSLRAISVLLVIIHHWMPWTKIKALHLGEVGVNTFFVLSGFLITRILMENKNQSETNSVSKTIVFKNFFVRRALRIFPIYYLTIFLLLLFASSTGTGIKEHFLYFVTYTSNFYFEFRDSWDGIVSHLWSLAIEEQFYLFWPFVILFTPKKYLLRVISCFIAIGIITQYSFEHHAYKGSLYTFSFFDAFGLGAILSWISVYKPENMSRVRRLLNIPAALCLLLLLIGIYQGQWLFLPLTTIVSIAVLRILSYIIDDQKKHSPILSLIFDDKRFIFIGKLSYGIYLYHLILPHYTSGFLNTALNSHLPQALNKFSHYILMIENFGLLLLLSYLSWIVVEKPLLSLKKYFEYDQTTKVMTKTELKLAKSKMAEA